MQIHVFEKGDSIGGRAQTATFPSFSETAYGELGPSIYTPNNENLVKAVETLGLETQPGQVFPSLDPAMRPLIPSANSQGGGTVADWPAAVWDGERYRVGQDV